MNDPIDMRVRLDKSQKRIAELEKLLGDYPATAFGQLDLSAGDALRKLIDELTQTKDAVESCEVELAVSRRETESAMAAHRSGLKIIEAERESCAKVMIQRDRWRSYHKAAKEHTVERVKQYETLREAAKQFLVKTTAELVTNDGWAQFEFFELDMYHFYEIRKALDAIPEPEE